MPQEGGERVPIKEWVERRVDTALADELCRTLPLSRLAAEVLTARGVASVDEARALFTHCPLPDPYTLLGMDAAVARIHEAVAAGEKICVYGDYDVDGLTATAIVYSYLEHMGAQVMYYIPAREGEGYGLNVIAIDSLSRLGVSLIVTVDNGVTAVPEIAHAASLGIDVVVTDHHAQADELPQAVAVVDPHRRDDTSGLHELCGAGVALLLVAALEEGDAELVLDLYADLAALGTIADVMPMTGVNRTIIEAGLHKLRAGDHLGLHALCDAAGCEPDTLTQDNIAFLLVPRLNAAGRVGDVYAALELLLTDDDERAHELAQGVCDYNNERKRQEQAILADLAKRIAADGALLDGDLLIFTGEGWNPGVTGIVAARMVDRFHRPCVMIAIDGPQATGSARSVEGFVMNEALMSAREHLVKFGGHAMAAGFTADTTQLPALERALHGYARDTAFAPPVPRLMIDKALAPGELTAENVKSLEALRGCGLGEAPAFAIEGARLEGMNAVGDGSHTRLRLSWGDRTLWAMLFGTPPDRVPMSAGDAVSFVAQLDVNVWNGEERLSIKILDLRPADFPQQAVLEDIARLRALRGGDAVDSAPDRDTLREQAAIVYRRIRAGTRAGDPDALYCELHGAVDGYFTMCVVLESFVELGLVAHDKAGHYAAADTGRKVDLFAGSLIQKLYA